MGRTFFLVMVYIVYVTVNGCDDRVRSVMHKLKILRLSQHDQRNITAKAVRF